MCPIFKFAVRAAAAAVVTATLTVVATILVSTAALAQSTYPSRPIRLVTPYAPGGPGDLTARRLADALSKRLGQPVIVDNKPGAGGVIGADVVAKAAPDGHTLLAGANGTLTNSLIRRKMPYAATDLVPVSGTVTVPSMIFVDATVKATSLKELQALALAQPNPFFFATTGIGSSSHFAGEMLKAALGIPLSMINYKSGGESYQAMLAGQVQVLSEIPNKQIESYVAAGKVRLLAVADDKRMKEFPNVPTTAEAGFPDIRLSHWAGIFATKGTPDAVLDKLNAEIQAAIQTDAFKAGAAQQNAVLLVGNRAEFTRQIRSEADTLGKIASELKIIAE